MKVTRARGLAVLLGAVAVAAGLFVLRPQPLEVDTATVQRRGMESTVDADGRTRVRERYVVVAPVAGRVERITRVEGSAVRAGDVVARLAPLPLDSLAGMQAQAHVDAAAALALEAAAPVRVASAQLDQRRRELSRARRLAAAGAVALREVEESELAQLQAEEALRAAEHRMRAAEADARQARAVLMGRNDNPEAIVLVRAPASGRVLRVPERSERIVAAGAPLMELGDPTSLEVVIDVLSTDAASIHPGDAVRLTDWEGGNGAEQIVPVAGHVREIEPAGFTKVSALGVEEQRVNVIVGVDAVPPGVGDGFRVEASVIVWSAPNVTVVPRSALLQPGGDRTGGAGWSVFMVKAGRVEARAVRVGHVGGASAEVLAGIDAGEEVVVFPSDQVKPGVHVKARPSS
jgi:HlyD family secretion protein